MLAHKLKINDRLKLKILVILSALLCLLLTVAPLKAFFEVTLLTFARIDQPQVSPSLN